MKIGTDYLQFTKALALVMLIAYVVQIIATFVAICIEDDLSEPLLQLISSALGFYGVVYGCYAGNSAIEKAVNAAKQREKDTKDSVG